jgi:uncharacterized surface protein with fasciclin (FAS1) repeats
MNKTITASLISLTLFSTGASAGSGELDNSRDMIYGLHGVAYQTHNQPAAMEAPKDIVDTAMSAGSFNTLLTAVKKAGLVDTLKGNGPFTVFAPTDDAFAQIPQATLQSLLADREALTKVLTYHVVPGKVMASDVMGINSAQTVQGQSITIDTRSGVKVDNANVIVADIETSNGVIHVIDSVILPKS